jgi:hypothetical protein
MSIENSLWGAPRIRNELLKLGIEVAQSKRRQVHGQRRGPPSRGWWTLRHHARILRYGLVWCPDYLFDRLYAFFIVRLDRRDLVGLNVTTNSTAEWIARQITEALPLG